MSRHPRRRASLLALWLSLQLGCTLQAPYMQDWESVDGIEQRWAGGTIDRKRLSKDEAAVYKEWGKPDTIRFFRSLEQRQRVYEWIYLEREETAWFIDGKRAEYVAIDDNLSRFTKEERETIEDKLTTAAFTAVILGGLGAGAIVLSDKAGLKKP